MLLCCVGDGEEGMKKTQSLKDSLADELILLLSEKQKETITAIHAPFQNMDSVASAFICSPGACRELYFRRRARPAVELNLSSWKRA